MKAPKAYKTLVIYGERCSGTNFLQGLLTHNFTCEVQDIEFTHNIYYWKHGYPPTPAFMQAHPELFFVSISKNPYAWLHSFHKRPHAEEVLVDLTFDAFLKQPLAERHIDSLVEKEKHKAQPYLANPVALWNSKNEAYLEAANTYDNWMHFRYEDLLEDLQTLTKLKGLSQKNITIEIEEQWYGSEAKFGKPERTSFEENRHFYLTKNWEEDYTEEQLHYVNQFLNAELLEQLGYQKYQPLNVAH